LLFGGQLSTVAGEEDVVVRRRRSHSPGHSSSASLRPLGL
jgi:hypothetical protein